MIREINGAMVVLSYSSVLSALIKITLTTALALVAAGMARGSRAAARHALLAVAFAVLVALPAVSIVVPPVRIAVPGIVSPHPAGTVSRIAPRGAGVAVTPVASPSWKLSPSALLFAGWIAGAALFLLPMGVGLRQVRLLRRTGVPWPDGQSVAEGLTLDMGMRRRVEVRLHETLPGPMTCGVAHPTVVLPLDARNWNGEDLNRAIVHELEHVRRGDWVSHCLARAVCALYWFHPLVWMALRRLALEAERSCDDAVLARSEATAYADQLIGVARRVSSEGGMSAAKPPLLAMANRADLTTRVRAVLDSGQRRGRVGAFPVALACAAAAVLVIALSPLRIVAAPQSATPNFLVRTMLARLYYDRGPENA